MAPVHVNGVRDYVVDLATDRGLRGVGPGDERRCRQARRGSPRERDPLTAQELLGPEEPPAPRATGGAGAAILALVAWMVVVRSAPSRTPTAPVPRNVTWRWSPHPSTGRRRSTGAGSARGSRPPRRTRSPAPDPANASASTSAAPHCWCRSAPGRSRGSGSSATRRSSSTGNRVQLSTIGNRRRVAVYRWDITADRLTFRLLRRTAGASPAGRLVSGRRPAGSRRPVRGSSPKSTVTLSNPLCRWAARTRCRRGCRPR